MPDNVEELSKEQAEDLFGKLDNECRLLMKRAGDVEGQIREHVVVLEALEKVEPERRCFRMIGGALAERTVKDVVPNVTENKEKLEEHYHLIKKQLDVSVSNRAKVKSVHKIK